MSQLSAFLGKRSTINVFLFFACVLLFLLWLPIVRYPAVSDTAIYAKLGQSLFEDGKYNFNSLPHAKYLPLHPVLSYPFTQLFGWHLGMHVLTLVMGCASLIAAFLLIRKTISLPVAYGTVIAMLLHPAFLFMAMHGSADLTFLTLFLFSLLCFVYAEKKPVWYIGAGVLAGLSCLTRYNGLALFPLFLFFVFWKRPTDLRKPAFWLGMSAGVLLFALWPLRNFLVFENPFFTEYTSEIATRSSNPFSFLIPNTLYYLNPLHNIFPFLFPFALIGLWRYARTYPFLVLAMLAAWVFTAIWWVQAIRFAFPGYVILTAFAILGIQDTLRYGRRYLKFLIPVGVVTFLAVQGLGMCLYTYGACNAAFDRTVGIVPASLGISTEGFYTWDQARQFLHAYARPGDAVFYDNEFLDGVFRSDLRVSDTVTDLCPSYYLITQNPPEPLDTIVYRSDAEPHTFLLRRSCDADS